MHRVLIGVLLVLALLAAGVALFQRPLADALVQRAIAENVGIDPTAGRADGLYVYVCGAGSPLPDARHAGPCVGVMAGQRAFVFDAGSGSIRKLSRMGFPMGRIEGLYLTHLHSDHIDGMGELLLQAWVGGTRTAPLPVVGPAGTQTVVDGFNAAYAIDSTYRVAHHGAAVAPPQGFGGVAQEFALPQPAMSQVLLDEGGLKITAFRVDHEPVHPAVGYRIEYQGRSVVISGDTAYSANVVAAARGANVLIHDALQPRLTEAMAQAAEARGQVNLAKILRDIPDYHATPEQAAQTATEAGAGELVLIHTVPPLPGRLFYPAFLGDARDEFAGRITMAEDGLLLSLPVGSDVVRHQRLF
jgi:ribonuclease Z